MPGFNIRKHLKAYVKYNLKNGQKIVPGSLIFREKQPKDPGIWREVNMVKCCTGGGGGVNCAGGGFWVDVIDREFYNYPISTCVGNDCSVYYFTQGNDGDIEPHFLKFTSGGDLVWSAPYEESQYRDNQSIKAIPDNSGAIAVREDTLINLSAEDGSIVWHKSWGENDYVYINGVTFNRTGDIILFAMDYDIRFFFVKLDAATGTVITEKQIDFEDFFTSPYAESYTVPRIDSAGNIYVCGTYYYGENPFNYSLIVIKLDQNFDVIWSKYLNYVSDDRTYNSGFDIDSAGNSYVVDADITSLAKVNTSGLVDWAIHCQGTDTGNRFYLYCCAVSPEGDVYWVYNNSNTVWDTSGDGISEINVFKFNTEGVLQWVTAIAYAPGGIKETLYVGGWRGTNDPIEFKNGVLVICGNMPNPSLNHLIKVSPTQTTGTFGDFIYEDITDKVTVVAETVTAEEFTLTTGLSTYFDVSNEKSTTFTLIENPTTVTTTPT